MFKRIQLKQKAAQKRLFQIQKISNIPINIAKKKRLTGDLIVLFT